MLVSISLWFCIAVCDVCFENLVMSVIELTITKILQKRWDDYSAQLLIQTATLCCKIDELFVLKFYLDDFESTSKE